MPENVMPLGTVLVGGENEEARESLGQLLRSQGYRVLSARDGAETAEMLRT
jgi:CheY-like chemotaxis protein